METLDSLFEAKARAVACNGSIREFINRYRLDVPLSTAADTAERQAEQRMAQAIEHLEQVQRTGEAYARVENLADVEDLLVQATVRAGISNVYSYNGTTFPTAHNAIGELAKEFMVEILDGCAGDPVEFCESLRHSCEMFGFPCVYAQLMREHAAAVELLIESTQIVDFEPPKEGNKGNKLGSAKVFFPLGEDQVSWQYVALAKAIASDFESTGTRGDKTRFIKEYLGNQENPISSNHKAVMVSLNRYIAEGKLRLPKWSDAS